jgi:hypothetical protein
MLNDEGCVWLLNSTADFTIRKSLIHCQAIWSTVLDVVEEK